jgi:hypothetical protein
VDQELAALMERARRVLAAAGITPRAMLDDLPSVRAEVVAELYGEEFVRDLEALKRP